MVIHVNTHFFLRMAVFYNYLQGVFIIFENRLILTYED